MIELIKALIAGIACGVIFALLKLPIPAPAALAGVIGIAGIFMGYLLINMIK